MRRSPHWLQEMNPKCKDFGVVYVCFVWPFQPSRACVCLDRKTGRGLLQTHPNLLHTVAQISRPATKQDNIHDSRFPINHSNYSTNHLIWYECVLCLTGSHRTICLWFQGELPVDRSIFNPPMYKTLLALWDLLLDTCRSMTNISTDTVCRRS